MLLLGELRAQLREEAETSLAPVNRSLLRPDLLAMMTEAKDWTMRSIKVGETNVKGHLFASMVSAQIEGMMTGLEGDEALAQILVKAADEVVDKCVPLLEEMLERETRMRMMSGGETDSGQKHGFGWGQGEAEGGMESQRQQQQQKQRQVETDGVAATYETETPVWIMDDWDVSVSVPSFTVLLIIDACTATVGCSAHWRLWEHARTNELGACRSHILWHRRPIRMVKQLKCL